MSLGILYLKRCIVSDGPWSVAPSPNGNSLSDRLLDTLTDVAFVKRFASLSSLSLCSFDSAIYVCWREFFPNKFQTNEKHSFFKERRAVLWPFIDLVVVNIPQCRNRQLISNMSTVFYAKKLKVSAVVWNERHTSVVDWYSPSRKFPSTFFFQRFVTYEIKN